MIYRSHRKLDLYPDSPEANAGRPGGWAAKRLGSKTAGRPGGWEAKSPAHCSLLTVRCSPSSNAGFTLIEVIAALIIISVLAAMIFPVTSGQWRTARGVGECRELFDLQGQMEEIVQLYKTRLIDGDGTIDLEDFQDAVAGYSHVDSGSTGFLTESGSNLTLTATPTALLLVTLTAGDQSVANIFSK